ncbi:MAG TPA: vWA domain-containing protein, partial [Candidatus Limnocylindrales bacterium]|nr:vWA domain-containing protein [Candidatus Limnocylindrales bacterium]
VPAQPGGVRVVVDSPAPGQVLQSQIHQARIDGSAFAEGDGPDAFDLMIGIDVSYSTRAASGVDVDGDGVVGVNPRLELFPPGTFAPEVMSTDPDDSILHAEVAAARALLDSLDPRRVRVGVFTFAGEVDPTTGMRRRVDQEDAWLEVPLTDDYDLVRRAFQAILARGASGATNFAAGIRLGIRELAGLTGARSTTRPDARKVILFLTDGIPTLPVGRGNVSDPGDKEAAIRAAQVARRAGIVINTYALGPEALTYPEVVTEMARATMGTYTPVQNPGDIIMVLRDVNFANVEDVVLTNLTTGDFSSDVDLAPDGTFKGFVPVREGVNRVRVSALASDGSRGSVEFDVEFAHTSFGDRQSAAELERIRRQNKQLELQRLEMEIEAFRAEQRKELELRPEPEPGPRGSDDPPQPEAAPAP